VLLIFLSPTVKNSAEGHGYQGIFSVVGGDTVRDNQNRLVFSKNKKALFSFRTSRKIVFQKVIPKKVGQTQIKRQQHGNITNRLLLII
jgi:hypothetical protein